MTRIGNSRQDLEVFTKVLNISLDELAHGGTPAQRETKQMIREKLQRGECNEQDAIDLENLAPKALKLRSNGKVPLSHLELDVLLIAVKGIDDDE